MLRGHAYRHFLIGTRTDLGDRDGDTVLKTDDDSTVSSILSGLVTRSLGLNTLGTT